jgi:hypothetical protein
MSTKPSVSVRMITTIVTLMWISTSAYAQSPGDSTEVKRSVTKFYTWYIATTKDSRYSKNVTAGPADDGKTTLETSAYFKSLDSLGVIHEDFIKSEKERFKSCDDHLKTIPWTTFSTADNFPAEDQCAFLYYYYWTGGHEPRDGVEVLSVTIDKKKATALIRLPPAGRDVTVQLKRSRGVWKINQILKAW